jgi:transposase
MSTPAEPILAFLGLDIAKASFTACLMIDQQQTQRTFSNSIEGFEQLDAWITKRYCQGKFQHLHACMEATGSYGVAVARFLHQRGYRVSIANPKAVHRYGESLLRRSKTDSADARLIALYCQSNRPVLWTPPPAELEVLQSLVRHLDALLVDRQQQANRLSEGAAIEAVQASLRQIITCLDEQITLVKQQIQQHIDQHPDLRHQQDLLESIPGIGALTAAKLLGEILLMSSYKSSRQVVAYAGLCPSLEHSGSSSNSPGHLSRLGNARVRKALYMPAQTAVRHNPVLKALKERLLSRGKRGKQIIVAAMRKLLVLAYGVLKSDTRFDPHFALAQS